MACLETFPYGNKGTFLVSTISHKSITIDMIHASNFIALSCLRNTKVFIVVATQIYVVYRVLQLLHWCLDKLQVINLFYDIEVWTKWPSFCIQHFSVHIIHEKVMHFDYNFHEVCPLCSNWQQSVVVQAGSTLNRWLASTWNHHPVHLDVYASLVHLGLLFSRTQCVKYFMPLLKLYTYK